MNYSISHVPKYTSPEERYFLTYLDDKKCERFMQDPDKSFKNTKIINFDIIHHECRDDKLEKRLKTILKNI